MSRLQYLYDMLNSFQDLFNTLHDHIDGADYNCDRLPLVGDVGMVRPPPIDGDDDETGPSTEVLGPIDEEDFYCTDFRDGQQMYMLFYLGASNYFPGIWIGNETDEARIEEMPIYTMDLASGDSSPNPATHRNLRHMLQEVVNWCVRHRPPAVDMAEVERLQRAVLTLSERHVDKGDYVVRVTAGK